MKRYIEQSDGSVQLGASNIPADRRNRDRQRVIREVKEGKAEIVVFDRKAHSASQVSTAKAEKARAYLAETSVYVERLVETDKAIPSEIATKRAKAYKDLGL